MERKVKKRFFPKHRKSSALVVSVAIHVVFIAVAVTFVAVKVVSKGDTVFRYEGGSTPHPHQVVIDLGKDQTFRKLRYLPRNGANPGKIRDYRIYASEILFDGLKADE